MTAIHKSRISKGLIIAMFISALLLAFTGRAEAIPPPELVRIGSVFVQVLAVSIVFLSTSLFFLRRQLGRLLRAMRFGRSIVVASALALAVAMAAWGASSLYVKLQNRRLLAAAGPSTGSATLSDGVMAVAGMQFDITDPSLAIAPREAARLLGAGSHLFVDIREPVEFGTRHVPGFTNIRSGDLMAGGGYRKFDKAKTIVLLCEAGERGSAIAAFLRLRGYRALFVDKGIRGWIEQKQPVAGSAGMQLPDFANKYEKITADTARGRLAAGKAVLVDVRSPAEFGKGHIAGAINIPLVNLPSKDLEQALGRLPKEREVIGIAYDRFGAYYCLIVGYLLDQRQKKYGGTLMMPPPQQTL